MRSQPLDPKYSKKFEQHDKDIENITEENIISQRIGELFDDWEFDRAKRKVSFKTWICWKHRKIKEFYYNSKYTVRNHFIWHKTIKSLRPWEGFSGLINVMQTHLRDYIETEEKYGHSEEKFKQNKIATAKETVELLERMNEPDDYSIRCRNKVDAKYPDYKSLITKYENGSTSSSGRFIAQGNGWTGMESGKHPREGYFEFIDGIFELEVSPDQNETDMLINELKMYNEAVSAAYMHAETDSNEDFDRLGQLLKDNLYSWWD